MTDKRVTLTVEVPFRAAEPRQEHLVAAEEAFKREVGQPVEDVTVTVTSIRVGKSFKASVSAKVVSQQEELPLAEKVESKKSTTKNAS